MSLLNDTLRRLEERTGRRPDPANTVTAGTVPTPRNNWLRVAAPTAGAILIAALVASAFHFLLGPGPERADERTPIADSVAEPEPLASRDKAPSPSGTGLPLLTSPAQSLARPTLLSLADAPTRSAVANTGGDREVALAGSEDPAKPAATESEPDQASSNAAEAAPEREPVETTGETPTAETPEPDASSEEDTTEANGLGDQGVGQTTTADAPEPASSRNAPLERAQRLQDSGRWQASVGVLQSLLEAEPEHLDARLALGRALRQLDRPAAAVSVLTEGRQHHPDTPELELALARAQIESGNAEATRELLANWPDDRQTVTSLALLAQAHQRLGEHAEAVERYLELTPQTDQGRHWLGLAHSQEHTGDRAAARESYRRALDSGDLGPASQRHAENRWETLSGFN